MPFIHADGSYPHDFNAPPFFWRTVCHIPKQAGVALAGGSEDEELVNKTFRLFAGGQEYEGMEWLDAWRSAHPRELWRFKEPPFEVGMCAVYNYDGSYSIIQWTAALDTVIHALTQLRKTHRWRKKG